jgi:hypothetical protein
MILAALPSVRSAQKVPSREPRIDLYFGPRRNTARVPRFVGKTTLSESAAKSCTISMTQLEPFSPSSVSPRYWRARNDDCGALRRLPSNGQGCHVGREQGYVGRLAAKWNRCAEKAEGHLLAEHAEQEPKRNRKRSSRIRRHMSWYASPPQGTVRVRPSRGAILAQLPIPA